MNSSVSRYLGSSIVATETVRMDAEIPTVQTKSHSISTVISTIAIFYMVLINPACSLHTQPGELTTGPSGAGKANGSRAAIWADLLQKTPFPHTAPLPPRKLTVLDGTYAKIDPKKTPPVPCRRCPDYVPEGGVWKLQLDKGVFRIFHEFTGWRSIGSFVVEGNRVQLFNDPTCMQVTGSYTWTLKAGRLSWRVVQDECAIGMRAKNLMQQPWLSCQPLSMKSGWEKPPGCD